MIKKGQMKGRLFEKCQISLIVVVIGAFLTSSCAGKSYTKEDYENEKSTITITGKELNEIIPHNIMIFAPAVEFEVRYEYNEYGKPAEIYIYTKSKYRTTLDYFFESSLPVTADSYFFYPEWGGGVFDQVHKPNIKEQNALHNLNTIRLFRKPTIAERKKAAKAKM